MRKRLLRAMALWLLPPIGALLIRFLYYTNKKRFHLPQTIPSEPVIFAFWHGDLLIQPFSYLRLRQHPKIKILISEHFDGEIIAKTTSFFCFETLRGSSRRGGAKVLIQALKALSQGYDIGITPDGPKGPRHSVSDGIIAMAQKQGAKVIVLNSVPSRYWQLSSWDRFVIPKPFGTIDFYASEPLDLEELGIDEAKAYLKERLMTYAL